MAKSMRSKVKRSYRAKKRVEGIYAATEAARLQKVSSKLMAIGATSKQKLLQEVGEEEKEEQEDKEMPDLSQNGLSNADGMDVPSNSSGADRKVSTHGRTPARREEWRLSKGWSAKPPKKGINKQGAPEARRKAGRSHRRR